MVRQKTQSMTLTTKKQAKTVNMIMIENKDYYCDDDSKTLIQYDDYETSITILSRNKQR